MKSIWKFELHPDMEVQMPQGAEILSVRAQGGSIMLWAVVNPEAEKELRTFDVVGTGWNIGDELGKFIGTVQLASGLVFHVFEEVKR